MTEPFLTVTNRHIAGCGNPPALVAGEKEYTSYFENGEQAVFRYDKAGGGYVVMGDAGWDRRYPVTLIDAVWGGQIAVIPDLILSACEQTWVAACLNAVGYPPFGSLE